MREPSSVEWAICPPYFAVIGMEFSEFQPAPIIAVQRELHAGYAASIVDPHV
jgi:hypothetical protein